MCHFMFIMSLVSLGELRLITYWKEEGATDREQKQTFSASDTEQICFHPLSPLS